MGDNYPAVVNILSDSVYNEFAQYRHCDEANKHVYFSRFEGDDIDDHTDSCVVHAHSTLMMPAPLPSMLLK
jgi:hypothetical protein